MIIVKKIKLVLLTSVVILSTKDVYAMDPDYQEASSSHHPPHIQTALQGFSLPSKPLVRLELYEGNIKKIILNAAGLHPSTAIYEQSRKKLRTILSQISKEDILSRLEGIRQLFLLKLEDLSFLKIGGHLLFAKRDDMPSNMGPALMRGMYSIVAKAFLLPKHEIIARGVTIKKMVNTLFKIAGFDIARSFKLINYALGLTVDQINERTTIISEYENYLVPQDNKTRPMVIESLFKDDFRSLLGRVALMTAYEEEVRRTSSSSNRFNAEKALNRRKAVFSQLTLFDLKNALTAKLNETTP